jgi:hypothetical protein
MPGKREGQKWEYACENNARGSEETPIPARSDGNACDYSSPMTAGRGGKHKEGRAGSKRLKSGGTLYRCDDAGILWSNKCRRRVLGMEGQQDRDVRLLIELSKQQTATIHFAVQDQTSNQQATDTRDVGVACIVLVCEKFDVSTRTLALSIAIHDMFLAKTNSVAAAENGSMAQHTSTSGAQNSFDNPAACFTLACKYVEVFAPRLIDVCSVMSHRCTSEGLRNAENNILDILGFDIAMVTGDNPDKPNPRFALHLRCMYTCCTVGDDAIANSTTW